VKREDWSSILDGFARCVRILKSKDVDNKKQNKVDEKLFVEPQEKELYAALQAIQSQPSSVNELLETIQKLIPSINNFFDKVMVMAEDKKIKENRLALVGQIANLSHGIADLSKLEGF
jgi:glycyl-tRNA synthetase beta chain